MDENDTKRIIQLCVKIKKRCYTNLLHFSTHKHNLVFFSRLNHILTVELCCIFFFYIFFFQDQMLGDISFKLETKIMIFMSVFFLKKYNQNNSSVVNNMRFNFSLYRAPLQSLGLFLLILSHIFDFKCHSYHYIILTDYPGIQFHRYIS